MAGSLHQRRRPGAVVQRTAWRSCEVQLLLAEALRDAGRIDQAIKVAKEATRFTTDKEEFERSAEIIKTAEEQRPACCVVS